MSRQRLSFLQESRRFSVADRWPASRRKPRLDRVWLTGVLAAVFVLACEPTPEQVPTPAPEAEPPLTSVASTVEPFEPLRLDESREGALPSGGTHDHPLELSAGDAFLIEVTQDHIDLEVTVLHPNGDSLIVFDSPVARRAPERVCGVTDTTGDHIVRLSPLADASGDYTLRLERLRSATDTDHRCARATRLFAVAESRRSQDGPSEALAGDFGLAHDLWFEAGEPLLATIGLRQAGRVFRDLGDAARAADAYTRALTPARTIDLTFLEISLLNRLGLALRDLGELPAAVETLSQALQRARETRDRRGEASALQNLARVEQSLGETHRAIDRYQQILPIWRELGNDIQLAQTQMSLADAYALLDHHQDALNLLGDAEAIFRRLDNRHRLAHVLALTGWVHHLRGQPENAITPLRNALELYRGLGNRDGETAALDRLGTVLREIGNFAGALDAYRQSLRLAEAAGSPKDAANTTLNIGCLYQEWGRPTDAGTHLADARERLRAIDDPKGRSHVEYCQARLEKQQGNLDAALEALEKALAIVDELRDAARRHGARYRPIWLWQDYAELHLELLMAQYRATSEERFAVRAFETSDLARARNLFELVLESRVGVRTTAPQALLDAERDVQRRLNAARQEQRALVVGEAPLPKRAAAERRLGELALELEQTRQRIRAADPRFAELAAPRPISLESLQTTLSPGTVLLSYALGEDRSYLFAVSPKSFRSWPLAPRAVLKAQAQAVHEALRHSRFNTYQATLAARRLSEMLLPAGTLSDSTSHIMVVADGMLHYVPMSVLPSPRGGPNGDIRRLLVDDFEIRYLPSASVLRAFSGRVRGQARSMNLLAVLADPVFSDDDPRLNPDATPPGHGLTSPGTVQRLPSDPLPRLPHTHREARAILDLVDPGLRRLALLGFDATKQAVIDGHVGSFQILHFATHALIDERFPDLSGLVLARRDAAGRSIDGDLHLHEIYGLRLDAELVVLSGCQTALGQRVRGDGLVSLTRGFLYAGASQLLVSLWSVDDQATAELMAEFYRGLLERGEHSALALRSAQLKMRASERWNAPYYWAGFVLQDTGR